MLRAGIFFKPVFLYSTGVCCSDVFPREIVNENFFYILRRVKSVDLRICCEAKLPLSFTSRSASKGVTVHGTRRGGDRYLVKKNPTPTANRPGPIADPAKSTASC